MTEDERIVEAIRRAFEEQPPPPLTERQKVALRHLLKPRPRRRRAA